MFPVKECLLLANGRESGDVAMALQFNKKSTKLVAQLSQMETYGKVLMYAIPIFGFF
jgi:hypothetical protein